MVGGLLFSATIFRLRGSEWQTTRYYRDCEETDSLDDVFDFHLVSCFRCDDGFRVLAVHPVLPGRLLPRGAALGADYRGGRDGAMASLTGTYKVIQDFTDVVIDYNDGYAYIANHEVNRKHRPGYRHCVCDSE